MLDLVGARRDAGGHPFGEHLRLAGACAGLDQDVRQQLFANDAPRVFVGTACA
jgi:hypothetical protein